MDAGKSNSRGVELKKTAADNPYSVPPKAKTPKKVTVKMKGEAHEYDSNRPKNQVMSRYSK